MPSERKRPRIGGNLRSNQDRCPFCRGSLEEDQDLRRCPQCGVLQHTACKQDHGGCVTHGCSGGPERPEVVGSTSKEKAVEEPPEECDAEQAARPYDEDVQFQKLLRHKKDQDAIKRAYDVQTEHILMSLACAAIVGIPAYGIYLLGVEGVTCASIGMVIWVMLAIIMNTLLAVGREKKQDS